MTIPNEPNGSPWHKSIVPVISHEDLAVEVLHIDLSLGINNGYLKIVIKWYKFNN